MSKSYKRSCSKRIYGWDDIISSVEWSGAWVGVFFIVLRKNDVESFYHNSFMHFFQSELYTNVRMSCARQWFGNVQMHLCTFTVAHRELMHLCITLNRFTPATASNIALSFLPVDSMHFSVHYMVRETAHGVLVRLCTFTTHQTIYKMRFLRATAGTAIARLSHRNSVRLSVCLSHGWIRQKRCKLGSSNLHHRLPQRL